ncbi:MAG: hypothetical protein RR073_02500 [Clostridia bacterium]
MKKSKYLIIIGITIFTAFTFILLPNSISSDNDVIKQLSFILFQGIKTPTIDVFMKIFLTLLPILILVYPISNILIEDLQICSVYTFTRYASKIKWYFKKIFLVFIACFLAVAIYFIFILATFFIKGVTNISSLNEIIFLFINILLFIFLIALFINVTSLLMANHFAYLTNVCALILSAILATIKVFNTNILYYFNPINSYFYYWKEGNKLINSSLSLLITSVIIIVIGAILIKKIDIFSIDKELT